jgi:hypothetical protein
MALCTGLLRSGCGENALFDGSANKSRKSVISAK